MNLYNQFIKKQNEIITLVNQQSKANEELTTIKREIFKAHKERFSKKPNGKTVIVDDGFEINYNRTEKVTILTNLIEQDNITSDCFVEKVTPEKRVLGFSKTEYKKLSDDEQAKLEKYISKELNTPTLTVTIKE